MQFEATDIGDKEASSVGSLLSDYVAGFDT